MSLSAEQLERLYEQRRKPGTWKNAATGGWTPERCDQLTELWAMGKSCSQIAAEMGNGLTRNAVIGKVHRLRLPARKEYHAKSNHRYRQNPPPPKAKKPTKGRRPGAALPLLPEGLPGDLEALRGNAWAALPSSTPKPLLVVSEANGCRWPIGEERPYLFCGEPTHRGNYCAAHRSISFRPVPPKQPRTARRAGGVNIRDFEEA